METMIDLKTRKECQETEPFVRVFEEIDLSNRQQLREAGCTVKRITNNFTQTHIAPSNKTVQQVTFPSGTREEIQDTNAGLIAIRTRIYYLPNGQVYSEYQQGHESASLSRSTYYEQK